MKFSTILVSAFAAFSAATPTPEVTPERAAVNSSSEANRNGMAFNQVDLNYLLKINDLDLRLLQTLSRKNNLNLGEFRDLFRADVFSLEVLLQLQQLSTLLAIADTGIFDRFDLSRLPLGDLKLGLIEGIARLDLADFIDKALRPQIIIIAKQVTIIVDNKGNNRNDRDRNENNRNDNNRNDNNRNDRDRNGRNGNNQGLRLDGGRLNRGRQGRDGRDRD